MHSGGRIVNLTGYLRPAKAREAGARCLAPGASLGKPVQQRRYSPRRGRKKHLPRRPEQKHNRGILPDAQR